MRLTARRSNQVRAALEALYGSPVCRVTPAPRDGVYETLTALRFQVSPRAAGTQAPSPQCRDGGPLAARLTRH
jgi:hypothetical protein